ncbi:Nitroreductase [Vibrio chagasii]|nr:Nitroreductase [Vibrio chagasii]
MNVNVKGMIKKLLGKKTINNIRNYPSLFVNFFNDMILYYKHSTVFFNDNPNKIECQLILDYHSVEKGLLFYETKPRFAKERIINLHNNLKLDCITSISEHSQITVAYKVMCEYYELHVEKNIDINDYFSLEQYEFYKKILAGKYDTQFRGAISFNRDDFYLNVNDCFYDFSNSRKSIRKFTGEMVPDESIESAVRLALNTPSVCNRQASKVYLISDTERVKKILKIQGGLTGYTENINQLLILTVDRNYFYTIGERNQFYIDGGMFLMNLLYALHYNKIANCPANWGKTIAQERKIFDVVELPKSEKILCIIPIGIAEDEFRVTLSQRRKLSEVLVYS